MPFIKSILKMKSKTMNGRIRRGDSQVCFVILAGQQRQRSSKNKRRFEKTILFL